MCTGSDKCEQNSSTYRFAHSSAAHKENVEVIEEVSFAGEKQVCVLRLCFEDGAHEQEFLPQQTVWLPKCAGAVDQCNTAG